MSNRNSPGQFIIIRYRNVSRRALAFAEHLRSGQTAKRK